MSSIVNYVGNGSTTQFQIPFTYINATHVIATVAGTATTAFTFLNSTTLTFNSAPAASATIEIKRVTPLAALVDFTDGSTLYEADLDLAHKQNRFIAEEARDRSDTAITTVNTNLTNIDAVAAIAANVTTVATNNANVTTVAGISANTTTVAGISTDVTAVAGKATEVGRLGTSDAVADMALLSTADIVSDMNTLATADNVSDMNTLAAVAANVTTVAGISANVTTVATNNANVTAVAGKAAQLGLLGTSDAVADMNTLGAADIVADMNTLATSAIVSDMDTLADISANITTVAGISANATTVAGISADVTSVAGISANVTSVAGNTSNINTLSSALVTSTTFAITVASVGGSNYFHIDGTSHPVLSLFRNNTYIFDVSNSSNAGHPLRFKNADDSSYSTGVVVTGTQGQAGAKVTITLAADAPSALKYYCTVHGNGMGNTINVIDTGGSFSQVITVPSGISSGIIIEPLMRMPSHISHQWEIQVEGTDINEFCLAQSIEEIRGS